MPNVKRLALFLDGTWNTVYDNTNVYRAKALCNDSPEQRCYYSKGVGTQVGERLLGGLFGIGIDREVLKAYEWLVDNYEADARIYIFGFSRGAFTARSLAGFISICGLLKPGSPISLTQIFDRYRKGKAEHSIRALANLPEEGLSQGDLWLKRYSRAIPIWFQGVWDTVGAVGIPLPWLPRVSSADFAFLETDLRINETHGFHALAVDEQRRAFAPTLWTKVTEKYADNYPPRPLERVEQRWFVGAHANVGGGYPNDLLAQPPLQWLLRKAADHELVFNDQVILDGDEVKAKVEDSYAQMGGGLYRLLTLGRRWYRPIGAAPLETPTQSTAAINETIDASVFRRWREDPGYRPVNLQRWAQALQLDPAAVQSCLWAHDGKPVVEGSV
ncbi:MULTISPECIES: DUF2235 domain-containing protein [unclassified Pseudomonas]|uniref:DUF2235 domain-containing protein n=1 Tax=unclassified Pseudomonas TaxID=196821 RepID=UPI000BC478FF|nr:MULTISPECIES: DUF2235 domain-containing protein [unclassified Pseudomonas]PVZ19553.1 uncharacterized protein (DUF2235 family) [Pseudomonas sp. URIL14HWK12:I12]PVZ22862.1 uncharacterized protein (DUF2235 family) [Pseudomonas sp. URIL14HWK12:I10]PVZ37508.1 uncharacterized protein (DUF2235 family) [Pseudomonas sp. URIL14HWK12:I11]SNZ14953.1 Uncharacterized protein, PA2063/DUF2235 family [Pseudomonas sp. URIL14HWK12:I9]